MSRLQLEELPDDVLGHIARFVPLPNLVHSLSLVNRRWKAICDEEQLWQHLWRVYVDPSELPAMGSARLAFRQSYGQVELALERWWLLPSRAQRGVHILFNTTALQGAFVVFSRNFLAVVTSDHAEVRDLVSGDVQSMLSGRFYELYCPDALDVVSQWKKREQPERLVTERIVVGYYVGRGHLCIPGHSLQDVVMIGHRLLPFVCLAAAHSNGWFDVWSASTNMCEPTGVRKKHVWSSGPIPDTVKRLFRAPIPPSSSVLPALRTLPKTR